MPPMAYEWLTAVTRVSVPTVSIAKGRRAKRPSGRKPAPASSGNRAKRPGRRERRGLLSAAAVEVGSVPGAVEERGTGMGREVKEESFIIPGSLSVRIVPPPDAHNPV
jgi:hypothetical protein